MKTRSVGDIRARLVYAAKGFASHLQYDQALAACERFLQNLNTNYID